jgi:hypothetical protein
MVSLTSLKASFDGSQKNHNTFNMTWFEDYCDLEGKVVATEKEGQDFLKQVDLPTKKLISKKVRTKVDNVLYHHCPQKPKMGTKEWIKMKVDKKVGILEFAGALTSNRNL